jgi:acyl-CoA dehydrogenase
MLEAADLQAIQATAQRFAQRRIDAMVGTEGRDGDLDQLETVLDEAESTGLIAGPLHPDAGAYGIWGADGLAHGATLTLQLLSTLAASCAGVALCTHVAGLGALYLTGPNGATALSGRVAVACPPLPTLATQRISSTADIAQAVVAEAPRLRRNGRQPRVDGDVAFVHQAPRTVAFLVFARTDRGLARVLLEAEDRSAGLARRAVSERTGLAACRVEHLHLAAYEVDPGHLLGPVDIREYLRRFWLGLCAIAVGNAAGALAMARRYAAERYQGGRLIASQPAVQLLLGAAEARLEMARGALLQAASQAPGPGLRRIALLRARLPRQCARSVSDALQVFGGYGYMEDYRMEKRLRDALTLGALGARPDDLLRLTQRAAVVDPS